MGADRARRIPRRIAAARTGARNRWRRLHGASFLSVAHLSEEEGVDGMLTAEQREAIKTRLAEIEDDHGGRLTPDAVVKDARSKSSPLHAHFTWDVKEAAAAHWLTQARELITSVRVVIKTDTTSIRSV